MRFCSECCGEILEPEECDLLAQRFEDVHKNGAERFGVDWIKANEAAIGAAHELNIDPSYRKNSALLSVAVYDVMMELERRWKQ